jgi:hypothetical protein
MQFVAVDSETSPLLNLSVGIVSDEMPQSCDLNRALFPG